MSGNAGEIAIIGHACRLPGGANDPDSFWTLLLAGVDAVTVLPPDRFELSRYYHPDAGHRGRSYTFAAGTIGDVAGFDAEFFGISAREASQMDPQQRLLLELSWEALERAGQPPARTAGSDCAVYVGISGSDYAERRMGDLECTDPYFMLGATLSIAANRISYALDLRGPSMAVDTACSSSLVAMNEAVQTLHAGHASMAVVGGVNLLLSPAPFVGFASAGMLSPEGRCRAFGRAGEGYVRAEGGGVVVLKRLEEAERDGDPVLAVIAGIGVNSDGRTHGISLPSSSAQEALIRRVYREARISPRKISYFEAHGTGTRVGDPAEAAAVGAAVGAKRPKSLPLLIGSAKSNVGHLEPAAGMVGVIKAIEILRHGVAPPSLHLEELNPDIPFAALNLRPVTVATPLPDPQRAVVGVNSFGFGGVNAHVILRAPPEVRERPSQEATETLPFVVSGRTEAACAEAVEDMDRFLAAQPATVWRDIAYTACQRRAHHPHRLLLHAASLDAAREGLARFRKGDAKPHEAGTPVAARARVGLMFVGNGSQWDGMGRRLLAEDEVFHSAVERVDSVARWRLGWSPLQMLDSDVACMDDTRIAQPLLFALQVGLVESLKARGLRFDAVVGHSVGEVAAAYVSGALGLEQAVELVKERSEAQSRTRGQGLMLAASLPLEDALEAIAPYDGAIEIAAVNSPRAVTLAGETAAIQALAAALERRGAPGRLLDLDYAFHTASQDSIREQVVRGFAQLTPRATCLPFYSTVSGALAEGPDLDAGYWWRNIRDRVRFGDAIAAMALDGVKVFMEIGPQALLQGYLRQTLAHAKLPGQPIPTLSRSDAGAAALERSVDRAFVAGADVDFASAFPEGGRVAPLPTYPWQRERHWYERSPEAGLWFGSRTEGPLLGLRVAPGVDVWERQIDLGSLPWLADHALDSSPVAPAAAYVEMALEAGALLFPGQMLEIEAMEIHRPMLVDGRQSLMARFSWSASDRIFTVESRQRLQPSGWIVHVTGRLAPAAAPGARVWEPLDAAVPMVSQEDHYAFTKARGFAYGPSFEVVQGVRATAERAEATLALREDDTAQASGHRLPPALLDGVLQTVFPMLRARAGADEASAALAFVPTKIGRMVFTDAGRGPWRAEAKMLGGSRRSVVVDCRLYDADGAVVVELSRLRLTSLALGRPGAAKAKLLASRIEPLAPLAETPAPTEPLRAARGAVTAVGGEDGGLAALQGRLDAIAAGAAADALIALHDDPVPAARHARLARLIGVIDGCAEPVLDWQPAWRATLHAHPELLAELALLGRGGRALSADLRAAGPRLVPGAATLQHLYDGGPMFAETRRRAAQALTDFAAAWPADRRLRVLIATPPALAVDLAGRLPDGRCEITLMEAVASEVDLAVLAARNDVRTLSCDLVAPDGLPAAAFDLVVVVHGLAETDGAVGALRALAHAAAGGATLLIAETAPSAWAEVALGGGPALRDLETSLDAAGWRIEARRRDGAGLLVCAVAPAAVPQGHVALEPSHWAIVFSDAESPFAAALQQAMGRRGARVSMLALTADRDWSETTSWDGVWRTLAFRRDPPTGLVHLCGLAATAESAEGLLAMQDARCLSVLAAVRSLPPTPRAHPALRLVTRGAWAGPDGKIDPAQAPLAGLGRVLQTERPDLACRIIDLAPAGALSDRLADDLAAEVLSSDAEAEVLLRAGARHGPRLRPAALQSVERAEGELEVLQSPGGALDHLRWTRQPRLPLAADEVEIEVRAAGLNFRDVMFAMGALPDEILESGFVGPSLGMESAGVISRVGEAVSGLAVGDTVAAFGKASLASHLVTRSFAVARLPEGVSFVEGATLITAFFTVTYALKRLAALERGERILIHGGAGGVGMAAIQYALHCGAEVFATAGTEEKREIVRLLGVADDHVLDSRSDDFADHVRRLTGGEGVDVVLNSVAGEAVHRGLSLLRPFGRFIELGKVDFVANSRIGLRVFRNNIAYHGVDADELMARKPELSRQMLAETLDLLKAGVYAPLPYRVFRRERVVEAFRHMQRSRHMGKIVLDMTPAPRAEPPAAAKPIVIDPTAAYLITGGLGGLGLMLARWLAKKGARHLVLASRGGKPSEAAERVLADLAAMGVEVQTPACDVADEVAVAAVLDGVRARRPLKGVIHAAAVFDDALVADQTPERFRRVLAPKLAGGWALHRATAADPLDLFLSISSISAAIGNPGQANYVAANLFLESLTTLRRRDGRAAQLLALGPVADAGYLAERPALAEAFSRMGVHPLAAAEVVEQLDRILAGQDRGEVLADVTWPRLAAVLPAVRSPRFQGLLSDGEEEQALAQGQDIAALVRTAPPEEVLELLQATLVQLVAQILHVSGDKIDRERSVFELGMDSLMGLELKMSIEEKLGVAVPPMLLSQDVGVRRIAELIREQMLGGEAAAVETPPRDAAASERDYILARHGDAIDAQMIDEALEVVNARKGIRLTP